MEGKQLVNGTGRGRLFCITLLLLILVGSGMAYTSPDGEPPADMGEVREAVLGEPADATTYQGSGNALSAFYSPVLLGFALGTVIIIIPVPDCRFCLQRPGPLSCHKKVYRSFGWNRTMPVDLICSNGPTRRMELCHHMKAI